jgi:hypothetical protein
MIFTTTEQGELWGNYLAKYKDTLPNRFSYLEKDIYLFSLKLSAKEFRLNQLYIDYCFTKNKKLFCDRFEFILIKSFVFNKIDNLIIEYLKRETPEINSNNFIEFITKEKYDSYMTKYESYLTHQIPASFGSLFSRNYILLDEDFRDSEFMELSSLIVAGYSKIIISDYRERIITLNGEKLTLFKHFFSTIEIDIYNFKIIPLCCLLADVVDITQLNNCKAKSLIDLICQLHKLEYLRREEELDTIFNIRRILNTLIEI